jgi:hypothetical protein
LGARLQEWKAVLSTFVPPLDIDSIAQNMGFVKMAGCTKNRGKKMPRLVIFHNSLPDHRPGSDKRPHSVEQGLSPKERIL